MDLLEFVPKLGLLAVGVAAGILMVDLLDPVTPPLGRLVKRVVAYVQESLSGD